MPSESRDMDASAASSSAEKEGSSPDISARPILPIKTCPKCEDIVKNGSPSSIHFTLAYSRCRCHRSWKYSMPPAGIGPLSFDTRCVSAATNKTSLDHLLKGDHLPRPVLAPPSWSKGTLIKRYYMQPKSTSGRRAGLLPPLTKAIKTDLHDSFDNSTRSYNVRKPTSARPHHKQVSFVEPASFSSPNTFSSTSNTKITPKHTTIPSAPSLPPAPPLSSIPLPSSIPSLPQIQNYSSSTANSSIVLEPLLEAISSVSDCCCSDDEVDENDDSEIPSASFKQQKPVDSTLTFNKGMIQNFELVRLVKYVPIQQKIIASNLFDCLDQNGDGHLSFSEVLSGLTEKWQNVSAIIKLEHYLRPLYHVLGDDTYFSKRDFVLCYGLTQLFKERNTSVPYLANVDKEFYLTILKPFMIELLKSLEKDTSTASMTAIEVAIKKLDTPCSVTFNIKTANKLKKHSNGFTLLEILLFAPYIITVHK